MLGIEMGCWAWAAWGIILVAVALWYRWDARARREGPGVSNLAGHPILLIRPAWAALVRRRGVIGLLLALWTLSALEDWGDLFWLNRRLPALRDVWSGFSLASAGLAVRGTAPVMASLLRAVPPDQSSLAGAIGVVALIAGLCVWALFAPGVVTARLRGPLRWMLAVACVCLGLSGLTDVAVLHPELGILDWLWIPSWLTAISVTNALLQCFSIALIWSLVTPGTVSTRAVVGGAAACFGPLLCLRMVTVVPLAAILMLLGESGKYYAVSPALFGAIWHGDDALTFLLAFALMLAPWAVAAGSRGWTAAAKASLAAFHQSFGTMARFILQYALIFTPAWGATSVLACSVHQCLVGRVVISVATGLIVTMSMTVIALAYIHLTGEGAGRSETADNETPSYTPEVQTP